MGKGNRGVVMRTRPRAKPNEQQLAAMTAGKVFLATRDRRLTPEELRLIYNSVYPKATLTDADRRLQQGEVMLAEAVSRDLGADMQATYDYLVQQMHLHSVGDRPHNVYFDLSRHLWDTGYRVRLMGLSLPLRQLALIHSLPEHKARGLAEAKDIVAAMKKQFGAEVAEGLERLTDWDSILVDHLSYTIERIGLNGSSSSPEYLKKRLEKISEKNERQSVAGTLEDVLKLSSQSNKRLVPAELAGNLVCPEVKARLHKKYVAALGESETERLKKSSDYSNEPLVVKGLCLIDRLRTADGVVQVEKVTREAADFLPCLDIVLRYMQGKGRFNNVLEFVAAALKTELLTELDQRATHVGSMRDTYFARFADLFRRRLDRAREQYGNVATGMGYTPFSAVLILRPG